MSNKVSFKLLVASLAVCIGGIGTSHARPINPGTEAIAYADGQPLASMQEGASPQDGQLQISSAADSIVASDPGFRTDLALLSNYSGLKNKFIKHSWPVQTGEPVLLTGVTSGNSVLPVDGSLEITTSSLGVPEPGTLALLALGLVGVALVRRRHAR